MDNIELNKSYEYLEERKKTVSEALNGGIKSEYLSINYNICDTRINSKLNMYCWEIMFYMSCADITRAENEIDVLTKYFCKALVECKTEDELKKFNEFMNKLVDIGGYAVEFYENHRNMINKNGINEAKIKLEEFAKKEEEKKNPVSKIVGTTIESKYFNIDYRPCEYKDNQKLYLNCASILYGMAYSDISRKKEQIDDLEKRFYEALVECKTEDELRKFDKFMIKIKFTGGYAIEFYKKHRNEINKNSIHIVKEKLNEIRKNEMEKNKRDKENNHDIKEFESIYENASRMLKNIRENGIEDEEDLEFAYTQYIKLKNEITYLDNKIENKEFVEKFENRVNEAINYLRLKLELIEGKKKNNRKIEIFKESYERAEKILLEDKYYGFKSTSEIDNIYSRFRELEDDLYGIKDVVDSEFISKYNNKIKEAIKFIKLQKELLEDQESLLRF